MLKHAKKGSLTLMDHGTMQEVAALEESTQALYLENQKLNKQQISLNTEVSSC